MLPRLAARRARGGGGQMYTLLVAGARRAARRPPARRPSARYALGLVDEVAPADALSHALGVARRDRARRVHGHAVVAARRERHRSPFPNVERDPEIQRLLAHHARVPRAGAGPRPSSTLVRLGSHAGARGRARRGGARVRPRSWPPTDGRAGHRPLPRAPLAAAAAPARRSDVAPAVCAGSSTATTSSGATPSCSAREARESRGRAAPRSCAWWRAVARGSGDPFTVVFDGARRAGGAAGRRPGPGDLLAAAGDGRRRAASDWPRHCARAASS